MEQNDELNSTNFFCNFEDFDDNNYNGNNNNSTNNNNNNYCQYINVTNDMPIKYAVPLYGYLMPILLVITIIANTLIVVVLSKRHMRTPTNIVLMAKALCDMFTLLIPAPWFIYMYTFGNHYKILQPVPVCITWHIMHEALPNLFHTASIWLTLILALQRYIYVCHPPLARRFCTMPIVYKCVTYSLVASAIHQAPRMFDMEYSLVEIKKNNATLNVCMKREAAWVRNIISETLYFICYYTFRILFIHLIPCIALVTLNLLLFRALKQAQKRRENLLASNKKNPKTECKKLRDSNCTTLMLIVVVSAFLLVEIPLAIVTLLHMISSSVVEFLNYNSINAIVIFINFFIIVSYPINFAIYCGMSRQFRETFKELFITRAVNARNGSSRYSIVNGPRTSTNETVL